MTDARVVRTRSALHRAISSLSAQAPVSQVTVSQLASEAQINRATFYKHFNSPSHALASFLAEELAPVSERYLAETLDPSIPQADAYRRCVHATLDHVERFRDLYTTAVSSPHDGVAQNLLCEHFSTTTARSLAGRPELEKQLEGVDIETAARCLGYAFMGALVSWIESGTSDREHFLRTISACAPAWWFQGS